MIAISKYEKEAIQAVYPNVHIVRTMKHDSKRHRYYCVEERGVMRLLNAMRGIEEKPERRRRRKRKGD